MGLYIKDMEIPTSCGKCKLFDTSHAIGLFSPLGWCRVNGKEIFRLSEKADFCPLVPVPPHGRLGDLDALMLKIREYIDEYGELDENGFHSEKWCAMKESEMVICEAPTVIPASEEG